MSRLTKKHLKDLADQMRQQQEDTEKRMALVDGSGTEVLVATAGDHIAQGLAQMRSIQIKINASVINAAFINLTHSSDDYTYDEAYDIGERPQPKPLEQLYGAMRMWRLWRLVEDSTDLTALMTAHNWVPGENISHAKPRKGDLSWYGADRSGFYGFTDISEIEKQEPKMTEKATAGEVERTYEFEGSLFGRSQYTSEPMSWNRTASKMGYVIGSALFYGTVVTATLGARAEKAAPETLILSEDPVYNLRLTKIADKYNLQLITMAEAKEMPTGLRPYTKEK